MDANVGAISGDTLAADNLEAAADGTGYNLGGGSVVAASVTGNVGGSVLSVSNAVTVGTLNPNTVTASALAADGIMEIADAVSAELGVAGGDLDVQLGDIKSDTGALVTRIPAALFAGITSLADWIRRIARKDAGSAGMVTAESEIDTGGTSTFSGTTDSLEAIRDRGDAAWVTGGGGAGGTNIVNVFPIASSAEERISNTTIIVYKDENIDVTVSVDATLTGMTLLFTVTDEDDVDILTILDADITRTANAFTVTIPDTFTTSLASHTWSLRDVTGTNNVVLVRGPFEILDAP
jgi:hypothetical protein